MAQGVSTGLGKAVIFALAVLTFAAPFEPWREVTLITLGGVPITGDVLDQGVKLGLYAAALAGAWVMRHQLLAALRTSPHLIALVGWVGLSALWAAQPSQTLYLAVVFTCTTLIGLLLAAQTPPTRHRALRMAFSVFFVLSVLVMLILPEVGIEARYNVGAWRGLLGDKNSFGILAGVAGVFFFSQLITTPSRSDAVGLLIALLMLVMSGSRSAMTAFSAAMGAALILTLTRRVELNTRTRRLLLAGAGVGGMLIAVMGVLFLTRWGGSYYGLDDLLSVTGRVQIWGQVGERISQRPLLGYGYNSFWNTPAAEGILTRRGLPTVTTHNGYLETAAELGVVGVGGALALLGAAAVRAYEAWLSQGRWFPALFLAFFLVINLAWSVLLENHYLWLLLLTVYAGHPTHPETVRPNGENTSAAGVPPQ